MQSVKSVDGQTEQSAAERFENVRSFGRSVDGFDATVHMPMFHIILMGFLFAQTHVCMDEKSPPTKHRANKRSHTMHGTHRQRGIHSEQRRYIYENYRKKEEEQKKKQTQF